MPTGKQIRAARVLLDWDADDLAKKCKLSRETILNSERGEKQTRDTTIEKIVGVFNDNGVEFIGDYGVQWIQHQVKTLAGVNGLKLFFEDVRKIVQKSDKEVVICGVAEKYLEKKLGENLDYHRKEMETYKNLKMRCLIEESDFALGASAYCQYRWQSKENFSNVPFYVYGDKMAIIITTAQEDPLILLIQNPAVAGAYRRQFETMWEAAMEPKKKKQE